MSVKAYIPISRNNSKSKIKDRTERKSKSAKKTKIRSRSKSRNTISNFSKSLNQIAKKQQKLKIVLFEDNKLSLINSINKHLINLSNEKLDDIEYLKRNDMDYKRANNYLRKIRNENIFLSYYEKYQFLLKLEDRIYFQNFITSKKLKVNEIISKNFINKPIKEIFKDIGLSIIESSKKDNKLNYNDIIEIFKDNKVFFRKILNFRIPNKKGTFEIQYYSLLNDLWFYFDTNLNINKNLDLKKLINIFNYLKPTFKDIPNMTDEHAICIFDYLINIMYIYKDSGIIDKSLFFSIILSCLTFK